MIIDIALCKEQIKNDEYANQRVELISRPLVAEMSDISRNEFYKARQDRLNAEFMLKIHWLDYQGEKIVEIRGKFYNVYRTYFDEKSDTMELYLTERVEA